MVKNIQLTPETFNLDLKKFQVNKQTFTKDFVDSIISTIFLCERYLAIASKSTDTITLIFTGSYGATLKIYIEENYASIVDRFIIESQVSSLNTLKVYSPDTEYSFDPITKNSTGSATGGKQTRYFFDINFI